jgi:transcriptional regulator with XRE-family HTH domain
MDWPTIRNHYIALLRKSGDTQTAVARRGGLSGQNAISKLLANNHRGPTLETFAKAVDGLGLSLAEFFASIEEPRSGQASLVDRLAALEIALSTLAHVSSTSTRRLHESSPAASVHLVASAPATSDDDVHALAVAVERRVERLVHAKLDPLIERFAAQMGAPVDALRDADSDAAGSVPEGRRHIR